MAAETKLPNDQWDGAWVVEPDNEWKPRPRTRVVGDIEWLARMSDKARAAGQGHHRGLCLPLPGGQEAPHHPRSGHLPEDRHQRHQRRRRHRRREEASPTLKAGTFSFSR